MARGVNGRRAIGAAVHHRTARPPTAGPLGPYAGTRYRHAYLPLPFVIGQCQRCFGWADDHRHTSREG